MAAEYVEVEVQRVLRTTDLACHIEVDGDDGTEEHWVPFSCIEENGEPIDEDFAGGCWIKKWFCDKEGIPYG